MGRDQDAVQSYLDDLLSEVEESASVSAPVAPPKNLAVAPARPQLAPLAVVALQEQVHSLEVVKRQQLQALLDRSPPTEPQQTLLVAAAPERTPDLQPVTNPTPALVPESPIAASVTETEPVVTKVDSPLLQWCDNGRPVWAQQRFDVLMFRVSGLTLAVPLIALGQIHQLTDDLTPIFGQVDWFMGLQPTSAGRIRTVNTALFVMPERYDPAFLQSARYVITIDGLDWGLAVDQVQQPTRLNPDDVTWRSERSKRPWLAGTVKAAMCALLDVPQMGRVLESHDRKRSGATRR